MCISSKIEGEQMNVLDNIMGVKDASVLWGLSAGTLKNYCAEGKVIAVKIEGRWIIDKNQPNPSQPNHPNNWRGKT
jgi:hypothetical protein